MTKSGADCAPSKVFWCPDLFPQVYRSNEPKKLEESWKNHKNLIFHLSFQCWIWPFSELKSVRSDQKWCCLCPQQGILMPWLVSTGVQVHWPQKIGRKLKKLQKIDFSGHICRNWWAWEVLKSYPKSWFWCFLVPGSCFWICQSVSECLLRFFRQLEGPKMTSSKKSHFSAPFPYWKAAYLRMKSAGLRHLLYSGFNAFPSPTG